MKTKLKFLSQKWALSHTGMDELVDGELGTLLYWDGQVSGWRNGQSLTLGWMSEWMENWAVSNAGMDE